MTPRTAPRPSHRREALRAAAAVATALLIGLPAIPAAQAQSPEGRGHGGGGPGKGGGQGRGQGNGPPGQDRGRGAPAGGKPRNGPGGRPDHRREAAAGPPRLGSPEFGIIREWVAIHPAYAAQPLPPGMRNRLAQGKPLPPGIAKRALPPDLILRLPSYPGLDYVAIGATVLLVETATGIIRSLLYDALLPPG